MKFFKANKNPRSKQSRLGSPSASRKRGIFRFSLKLVNAASRRGINVDVIAPADSNLSSLVAYAEPLPAQRGWKPRLHYRSKLRGIKPSLRNK